MQIKRVKFKDIEQVARINIKQQFKQNFFGSSPAPFIGRYGYPNINIGFLSPQEEGDTSHYDSPQLWNRNNLPMANIANMRYGLVNSRTQGNVKELKGKILEICQDIGMSKRGVDLEVNLKKLPRLNLKPEKEIIPFGPNAEVHKARLTSNPNVDAKVQRVVSDTDLKSTPAILSLYQKGFEESFLNKLLSVGNIGLQRHRKLVPTRWSITAVDDTVGKQLIKEVKDFQVGDYRLYFGGGWGNYYLILLFPEVWSYELFESYLSYKVNPWSKEGNFFSTDYEDFGGRKTYPEETAGGYYAARLGILEKMKDLKRQGSCLALRFITSEYNIPLGVWVCREACRKSLHEKPLSFSSQELMIKYSTEFLKKKFGFDFNLFLKESKLLKNRKEQKKIWEFN
jgi:DNA repair protein NreA